MKINDFAKDEKVYQGWEKPLTKAQCLDRARIAFSAYIDSDVTPLYQYGRIKEMEDAVAQMISWDDFMDRYFSTLEFSAQLYNSFSVLLRVVAKTDPHYKSALENAIKKANPQMN